ncbi:MAG TPA: proline--tRNA ligase [Dehalococcoidia bacterium]|nr:proline--tRNA ligase [Dehalococcoidia bacterium]
MRLSHLLGKTQRQPPADAETVSHRLLVQGGFVSQIAAGVYAYLPLGWRVLRKVEQIIREEMDAAGGQELMLPAIQPRELWKSSGRDQTMDDVLFRLKDKRDREFVLGPTHEEVITELFKRYVRSYRDLPFGAYQIQQKFRDEPRPRGGLIRLRQFTMKDMYTFHTSWEDLDEAYKRLYEAYSNVFRRCGVPTVPVIADAGAMGGRDTHEFIFLTEIGEDTLIFCQSCGYAANAEIAGFRKEPANPDEPPLPLTEVPTPGARTIQEVAQALGVPETRTAKAVLYATDGDPVLVAIRGDMEVNEAKLRRALGVVDLRYLSEAEAAQAGLVPGSASAVGLQGVRVVADDLLAQERNLVAGANKPDAHLTNVNYERDWQAEVVADIALSLPGRPCPQCGSALEARNGIEMGHIFKLGTYYSERLDATYLDRDGKPKPVIMGCYGIGTERLLAAAVEANHDDKGIVWPAAIAPFSVHLVALGGDREDVAAAAESLYNGLQEAGVEVLFDDREESPGVKFNDADLLGLPLRVTISQRTLKEQSAEFKLRSETETRLVPLAEAGQQAVSALK